MTLDRLGRWRLPAIAGLSLIIAVAVVGAILLLGRAPTALNGSPSPRSTTSQTASSVPAGSTPESAVRAFYEALAEARETDDPSIVEPFVNGIRSSAYQTAAGFLEGQRALGIASITTINELTNFDVEMNGDAATVTFDHRDGGYDIELDTGQPLESPVALPERRKMAIVLRVDGRWLVDSFENVNP